MPFVIIFKSAFSRSVPIFVGVSAYGGFNHGIDNRISKKQHAKHIILFEPYARVIAIKFWVLQNKTKNWVLITITSSQT